MNIESAYCTIKTMKNKISGSCKINLGNGFLSIFTVAFLRFVAPVWVSNPAG